MTVRRLICFADKRYSEPKSHYTSQMFVKRCIEIYTAEQLINICLDHPNDDWCELFEKYRYDIMQSAYNNNVDEHIWKRLNIMSDVVITFIQFVRGY